MLSSVAWRKGRLSGQTLKGLIRCTDPMLRKFVQISVLNIQIFWDWVGSDFNGRVPGYSCRWAIIGDAKKFPHLQT